MTKVIFYILLFSISLSSWARISSSNVYCDPIAISTDIKNHYHLYINKDGDYTKQGKIYNYYLKPKNPGTPESNIEINLDIKKDYLFDTIVYTSPIETITNIFTVKFHLKSEANLGFIISGYNSKPTKEIDVYTLCKERKYYF